MFMRLFILAIGVGFLAFGLVLVGWSTQTGYDFHWRLERGDAVETQARVEDFRTLENERTSQATYELRYVFAVPGDDTDYTHDDDIWLLEQGEGWVDVPEDLWVASRESGEILVEYLEDDPTVNQPVEARRGRGSVLVFGAIGLVAALIGLLLLFGPLLGRRRRARTARRAAAPGPFV